MANDENKSKYIAMDIIFKGKYKSITDFVWKDIPKFAVLTGPNGSGKSHLLELIHYSVIHEIILTHHLEIIGDKFSPEEVSFLKGDWHIEDPIPVDVSRLQTKLRDKYEELKSFIYPTEFHSPKPDDVKTYYLNKKLIRDSGKLNLNQLEFAELLPDFFCAKEKDFAREISELFYRYRLKEIELLSQNKTQEEIKKKIGIAPWIGLRDILKASKLPFEINDASESLIFHNFELKLTHTILNEEIKFSHLSSGEKVILSLVFHLYSTQEKNLFPRLLLMDEPDAHLHPSMSQQFLDVVKKVLVDKYGIQVIMTTHSPSTVILAPEESIYEMSITEPRIRKGTSKNHCVSLLTGGLVFVGEGTKFVLVEDKDDVTFYSYVYRELIRQEKIDSDIPIVFIPASTKTESGGKNVVINWVEKLRDSGLVGVLQGLIDEDSGNQVSQGIYKIDRYCFENYLADPIFVFAVLIDVESDRLPPIEGLKFSVGEESKLKDTSQEDLQKIVDAILEKVETQLKITFSDFDEVREKTIVEITYTNGVKLNFPQWLLKRSGKDIINKIYNKVYSSHINRTSLDKAMRKLNVFPNDLLEKFNEIKVGKA